MGARLLSLMAVFGGCNLVWDVDYRYRDVEADPCSGAACGAQPIRVPLPGVSCGTAFEAAGGAECPLACSGGCLEGGICVIDCALGGCAASLVACPPERPCLVRCEGTGDCEGALVACPDGYACMVRCFADGSCAGLEESCSGGSCKLDCLGGSACSGAVLACDGGNCEAMCHEGALAPELACGSDACSCSPCAP